MHVPDGAQFSLYSYEEEGCQIVARLPGKSSIPISDDTPEDVEIDGAKAFATNAIQFDFLRDSFDRRRDANQMDPPVALMRRVVASLVQRLRYVTRAPHILPLDFPTGVTWRLRYLDDDERELPEDPTLIRGLGGKSVNVSFVALSPAVWNNVFELQPDWKPPVWDAIYLDAFNSLPDVGTSVVLAATSLEVFIADILDRLQALSLVPPTIWEWINGRDNRLKEPSTEEQFDTLLRHFTGHSLKDDLALWTAFKNLRQACNTFVHEGAARVGDMKVDTVRARQLLNSTREIIGAVRSWLPTEIHWPDFQTKVNTTLMIPLLPQPESKT